MGWDVWAVDSGEDGGWIGVRSEYDSHEIRRSKSGSSRRDFRPRSIHVVFGEIRLSSFRLVYVRAVGG